MPHPLDAATVPLAATSCAVDGCERPVKARSWCVMHYARWSKHGTVGGAEPIEHYPRGPGAMFNDLVRVTFSAERDDVDALEEYARREGVSRAAAIRSCIYSVLDDEGLMA